MVEKDVIHACFNGMLMVSEGDKVEIIRSRPMNVEPRTMMITEIVTIGRTFAMADIFGFGFKFNGPLAKFMKKVVHWWYLHSIGGFGLLLRKSELES